MEVDEKYEAEEDPHVTETDEICNEHRKLNENGWLERKSNKLHNEKL